MRILLKRKMCFITFNLAVRDSKKQGVNGGINQFHIYIRSKIRL